MEKTMTFAALATRTLLAGLALAVASSAALAWTLGPPAAPAPSLSVTPVATSVKEMPPKMRRAYIVGIQEELRKHGYRPGPADGILGARTRGAIRAYERDAKLPVTGVASKEILDHMKFVQPKVKARPGPAKSSLRRRPRRPQRPADQDRRHALPARRQTGGHRQGRSLAGRRPETNGRDNSGGRSPPGELIRSLGD
jgi:peptidoglycan hydrolase-like protein with peptidoglycan-binding domain